MLAFFLKLALIAQTSTTPVIENDACRDPERASHLCDASYMLWDLNQKMDRALDLRAAQLNTCERKLETMTATTVVHTKIVEVPVKMTSLDRVMEYLGAGAILLGGFGLGYLAFH